MIRVADYISKFLTQRAGVDKIFLVTGGGMMHLSDAVKKNQELRHVCTHHEQSAAMAATTYARYRGGVGACLITTGCGGTNAITGLLDAWQDSTPCIFLSGQVKLSQTVRDSGLRLRQFGVQEADIISIVEPICKYSAVIEKPEDVEYHMEKALYLAKSGRPGPVWLDVPLNVQGATVDESKLHKFERSEINKEYKEEPSEDELGQIEKYLDASERPIIIAGNGIRLAGAIEEFRRFVEKNNIPFVTPYLGVNLLPSDHPLNIGRIGAKGTRAGNFALQNSDLIISLGSRLSISSIGYDYEKFAREAKRVVIDIDPIEHSKKTIKIDLFVNSDAKRFLDMQKLKPKNNLDWWVSKCREWRKKWPVCLPEYSDTSGGINLYYFVDRLSDALPEGGVIISDAGSSFYATTQAVKIKDGQQYITSGGQAEMGFGLPASIGVAAAGAKSVVSITGDGSFQMNIQELQTIVHYKLPIKMFVWNNDGYLSIRATQRKFFESDFIGTDSESGVSFPPVEKIADAYGIKYFKMDKNCDVDKMLAEILDCDGPVLCEVICIRDQEIIPTVSSIAKPDGTMVSRPMEDMYPFLSREEFRENMIVKPLEE